jgi:hypothetical protein
MKPNNDSEKPDYIIIISPWSRREIAKRVLLRLFEAGHIHIHPARIEEEFARAQQVMDAEVLKLGDA